MDESNADFAQRLRLPSLEAFMAMTVPERTNVFIDWVQRQPPNRCYFYFDPERCALGYFAKELFHNFTGVGGATFISERRGMDVEDIRIMRDRDLINLLPEYKTFGDLAAAIRSDYLFLNATQK